MWGFLIIGLSYIIVLSLCYGEFYLSLHDVVTYSSKPGRILRAILPFIHTFAFFFGAYFFMLTLKFGILNFNLSDNIVR